MKRLLLMLQRELIEFGSYPKYRTNTYNPSNNILPLTFIQKQSDHNRFLSVTIILNLLFPLVCELSPRCCGNYFTCVGASMRAYIIKERKLFEVGLHKKIVLL